MNKIKAITLIMAYFGVALIIGATGTMDFYLKELFSNYPPYLNYMLWGGMVLMLPAFIYSVLKGE